MQYLPKNLLTREQISLVRHSKSRKMLQMPVLTVHNRHERSQQRDQRFKLRRIFCERFKDKQNINQQMPSAECSILKSAKSKDEMGMNNSRESCSKYKTHYKPLSNRPMSKLKRQSEEETNEMKQKQKKLINRVLKRLSKTQLEQNFSLLLQRRQISDIERSFNRMNISEYASISQSLSCKLMSYQHSNHLIRYSIKKELINRPSIKKKEVKKYSHLYRSLEQRNCIARREDELGGWQTNPQNKQGDQFNLCSLQTYQS